MRMAPETQGATYTIFLVAVEEIQNIPCDRAIPNLSRIVKDFPHDVGGVFLAADKTRAGKRFPFAAQATMPSATWQLVRR